MSFQLTGLKADTTYHYRLVARSTANVVLGEDPRVHDGLVPDGRDDRPPSDVTLDGAP